MGHAIVVYIRGCAHAQIDIGLYWVTRRFFDAAAPFSGTMRACYDGMECGPLQRGDYLLGFVRGEMENF